MILTISDSEEGILNKIKSVLACESTLEVMEITNSEKLTFQGLEIDQLQRSVIKDGTDEILTGSIKLQTYQCIVMQKK